MLVSKPKSSSRALFADGVLQVRSRRDACPHAHRVDRALAALDESGDRVGEHLQEVCEWGAGATA